MSTVQFSSASLIHQSSTSFLLVFHYLLQEITLFLHFTSCLCEFFKWCLVFVFFFISVSVVFLMVIDGILLSF